MKECRPIQEKLLLAMNASALTPEEKRHLGDCRDCAGILDQLQSLDSALRKSKIHSLTPSESVGFQSALDEKISKYQERLQNGHNLALRYSALAAAMALLLFLVFANRLQLPGFSFGPEAQVASNIDSAIESLMAEEAALLTDDDPVIDESYLRVVVSDYARSYGYNTGDILLGELSSEELEYIRKNFKIGDIL